MMTDDRRFEDALDRAALDEFGRQAALLAQGGPAMPPHLLLTRLYEIRDVLGLDLRSRVANPAA